MEKVFQCYRICIRSSDRDNGYECVKFEAEVKTCNHKCQFIEIRCQQEGVRYSEDEGRTQMLVFFYANPKAILPSAEFLTAAMKRRAARYKSPDV
jgi:hypothetical protein